jgi:DNA-binding NarL/FixJ family response regulator
LFAVSLQADLTRLRLLLESAGSRGIVIAENNDTAGSYLHQGFRGVVFRSVNGSALVECVRRVAAGETWLPPQLVQPESPEEDMVGTRVRDRLTPKEMRIVALIVQGCKNREIAIRLKTTEQVIKNYLRSIYDKTGVSDRLELALFTIHHRVLAQAAAEVANKLKVEELNAASSTVSSTASSAVA